MNFVLMHQSIVTNDAIGRDLWEMCTILEQHHSCHFFGEYVQFGGKRILRCGAAADLLADPKTIAIYHHSIEWTLGEQLLSAANAKIIFKYHNITPPNYFANIPAYCRKCLAGREQTYRFIHSFPEALWLSDSLYNLREIGVDKVVRHSVVPPFCNVENWSSVSPDETVLRDLVGAHGLQAFFIGRFAPNKGHLFLVDVLHAYRKKHGEEVTLFIAGKQDEALAGYFAQVTESAAAAQVNLCVLGELSPQTLISYFLGCDVYLCCSEHEGFCVPIVEAQFLSLPVVARARAAVPETLGPNQILHGEDPESYVDSLYRLQTDMSYRENLIQSGFKNYLNRFTHAQIAQAFRKAVESYVGVPV
jgi:hypothetical protein